MRRYRLYVLTALFTLFGIFARAGEKTIIAHRGASGYLPEHTLEGVAMAHAFGVDFIEQDVVLSKDNIPVVLHDIELEPVTDVAEKFPLRKRENDKFYAIDFTLAELKSLTVHERRDLKSGKQAFPERFPIEKGTFRIPTLEEELQLIQGLNRSRKMKIGVYTEIKSPSFHQKEGRDISKIVLEMLARYRFMETPDQCVLQCFEWQEVKHIRELGYQGKLIFLIGGSKVLLDEKTPVELNIDALRRIAKVADGIGPSLGLVVDRSGKPTSLVDQAHKSGLIVHPYTIRTDMAGTINDEKTNWFKLILNDAEADGVFTDQPDAGVQWKKSRAGH